MATRRRTHSRIDHLPAGLRAAVHAMLVDDAWPDDYQVCVGTVPAGKPRYADVVAYLDRHGHDLSESAIGRYALKVRSLNRLRQAADLAREVMADVDRDDLASAAQQAACEMITAHVIETVAAADEMSPKQLREVASAMRDCARVAIDVDKHLRTQLAERAAAADAAITDIATRKSIDPDVLRLIREQVYGLVS